MKGPTDYKRAWRERDREAREHRALRPPVPPGWTAALWEQYLTDPDGGRSPMRAEYLPPADSTPSVAEVLSWEAER